MRLIETLWMTINGNKRTLMIWSKGDRYVRWRSDQPNIFKIRRVARPA